MDTTVSSISNDFIHEHPLSFSAMFIQRKCDACQVKEVMYGSYFCNEDNCDYRFHRDCAESPEEISHHPSHPDHPLSMSLAEYGNLCDICGQEIGSTCYTCRTCDFKVDLICGTKPSPPIIEHPVCHDHRLVFLKKRMEEDQVTCDVCKEFIGGPSYSCRECKHVYFHLDCVHLSKEVDHSCHSSHPLKIMPSESLMDNDAQQSCCFCLVQPKNVIYHCSICNFTLCLQCTKRPPPRVLDDAKTHTHPLTLFTNKITFTCKVSGIGHESYKAYICLKCDFVVSSSCVGLPRIININRHDHRISYTPHLGHKGAKCRVCRKSVSQYYGAYSCSICLNYVVHSLCAADFSVWNGVELEGIPETSEDIVPFEVIGDNLIRHRMHEYHNLLLLKDYDVVGDDYERVRCKACISPIRFGPIYSCQECHFVLHEKCAREETVPFKVMGDNLICHCMHEKHNLLLLKDYDMVGDDSERVRCKACVSPIGFGPIYSCQECLFVLHKQCVHLPQKKTLVFSPRPYDLCYGMVISCSLCGIFSGGFKYIGYSTECRFVDLPCSSISEPCFHNGHLHPLYFVKTKKERYCSACGRIPDGYMLNCSDCDFDLCFYCATLPEEIWHISDEHPLALYYGGKKAICKNWCEVCEMELDSSKWFFTCSDCGVTLHVRCVLGDFSRLDPNLWFSIDGKKYCVVFNNQSRPFCRHCHDRCKAPIILQYKDDDEHNGYICSFSCLCSFSNLEPDKGVIYPQLM